MVPGISTSGIRVATARAAETAHSITNALTPGFRAGRLDLVSVRGGGVAVGSRSFPSSPGPLQADAGPFSLSVDGEGFFRVVTAEGARFTRTGSFPLDGEGNLVAAGGGLLEGGGPVPAEALSLLVTPDGRLLAVLPDGTSILAGWIPLYDVPDPGGLLEEGGGLFSAGPASGTPVVGATGTIRFGVLEGSSVSVEAELASLASARAALEAGTALLRVEDRVSGELLDVLA
jgi:flagellar basal body rod protein FlgG